MPAEQFLDIAKMWAENSSRERTAALVDELLDAAALDDGAPFDVMSGLAHVVPAQLFCWMIGAPDGDAVDLARLSKVLLSVFTATPEMV